MSVAMLLSLMASPVSAENLGYTDTRVKIAIFPERRAYAGGNITVRTRVEVLEDLSNVEIDLQVWGSKKEGYETWSRHLSLIDEVNLSTGTVLDENYTLTLPSDASYGLVYAIANIRYEYYQEAIWRPYSISITFQMTFIINTELEDLQSIYASLLDEHEKLKGDYVDLLDEYNQTDYRYLSLQDQYNTLLNDTDALNAGYRLLQTEYKALIADLGLRKNLNYVLAAATIGIPAASIFVLKIDRSILKKVRATSKDTETHIRNPKNVKLRINEILHSPKIESRFSEEEDQPTAPSIDLQSLDKKREKEDSLIGQAQQVLDAEEQT